MQVLSYGIYLILPFNIPVIILNIFLFGVGSAMAGEAVYKTFSQELFPTMLAISGVVGYFWMPNTAGKSLETIEDERGTANRLQSQSA